MQKYVKECDAIGVDNPQRFASNSDALDFPSTTESVVSVGELLKVYLLQHYLVLVYVKI
jgi:hypothetical protein